MKSNKGTVQKYAELLSDRYNRWKDIYENGCFDPSHCDGVNLSLVRNHIIYYKGKCDEELAVWEYPDEYFYPLPAELPLNFMAKDRKILGELKPKTKTLPYSEVVKFNWGEELKVR